MVAADHPEASRAGLEILERGGNAVDAAVATSFALAVVRPESCGIGGGGFMIIHRPGDSPIAIDYRECAPAAVSLETYRAADGGFDTNLIQRGRLSVAVPGTVRGLTYAFEKYGSGKLSLADVMRPAIRLARTPLPVNQHLREAIRELAESEKGQLDSHMESTFLTADQTAPTTVIQPKLARCLELIAREGAAAFYDGMIGDAIVETLACKRGIMRREDLRSYSVREFEPLQRVAFGHTVIAMPPPSSGGAVIIEAMMMFETLGVARGDEINPHLLAEVMKACFADRATRLGDRSPEVLADTEMMIDPTYVAKRAAMIDPNNASAAAKWGELSSPDDAGTSHFCVVDRRGMAVACTESINLLFGSQVAVDEFGFILNDTMDDFALDTTTPNAFGLRQSDRNLVRPGARPLSSMSPTIVLRDGEVRLVAGASGGPRIISSTLQTILRVIVEEKAVADAIATPRIHHQWLPETLRIQPFGPIAQLETLRAKGHDIQTRTDIGHCQAIEKLKDGSIRAACDPLKGGIPAGR